MLSVYYFDGIEFEAGNSLWMPHCRAGGNSSAHGTQASRSATLVQRLWPGTLASCSGKHKQGGRSDCFSPELLHLLGAADMSGEAEKVEPAESEQDEEEDVYEVERIIDMRVEEVNLWR